MRKNFLFCLFAAIAFAGLGVYSNGATMGDDPIIIYPKPLPAGGPRSPYQVPISAYLDDENNVFSVYFSENLGWVDIVVEEALAGVVASVSVNSTQGSVGIPLPGAGSYVATFTTESGTEYEAEFTL